MHLTIRTKENPLTSKDTDTGKLLENKRSVLLTTLNQNDQNKTLIEVKTSTKDITRYTRRTTKQYKSISKQTIRHDTQQD